MLLLNPTRFEWAKAFITYKAWELILSNYPDKHGRQFALPTQCPTTSAPKCLIEEISVTPGDSADKVGSDSGDQVEIFPNQVTAPEQNASAATDPMTPVAQTGTSSLAATTSNLHMKRKAIKVPIVDSDCRHSDRIKKSANGFKGKACLDRRCICCSTEPPTLSSKVIRSLGETLCKISPMVMSDKALLRKPKMAVQKKAVTNKDKASSSRKGSNDDKSKKKPKKN